MRAFVLSTTDTPPSITDLPVPEPATGEVRLNIRACGLNFADLLMARGQYQETPDLPFIMGMEVAGTVEALGDGVTSLSIGQRVAAFSGQGGLAEKGCFAANRCVPIPDVMPLIMRRALWSPTEPRMSP